MRIKHYLLAALLCGFGFASATEFRAPLTTERGPLRYLFEEWDDTDYALDLWAGCFEREAHKAFLSHGTSTRPLSALFFNCSDFTLGKAFPGACVDRYGKYYNPFLAVALLSPRITYEEKGLSLGCRFAYPIYKNKGRLGVRVHIPFRRVEIEREDAGDKDTNQLDDLVTGDLVTLQVDEANPDVASQAKDVYARAIRLDFLEALYYTAKRESMINYAADPDVRVVGDRVKPSDIDDDRMGAIINPSGSIPRWPDDRLGIHEANTNPGVADLPTNGVVADGNYYMFKANGGNLAYKDLSLFNAASCSAAQNLASQLWFVTAHKKNTSGGADASYTSATNKLWDAIDFMLNKFNENVYEWLGDRGFEFATGRRTGIGDIDVDLFYEHQFTEACVGEVMLGLRFPTGSNIYCCNPYRPHLGNGEHWEVKFGGLLAWEPLEWMNIKLDGYYSWVLEGLEKRMAAFDGACLKNIGPCVDADVDWSYFVGHIDFNLFHPKTDAISGVLGYEFYYKIEDNIDFRCCTIESWLGPKLNPDTLEFEQNLVGLSGCAAARNTQAIAHRLRLETSFRITKWFELFLGGAYTFAGRNIPRETDCHGGCVVTF